MNNRIMNKQPDPMVERTSRSEQLQDLGGRTQFERDYSAILYSHAFRRLRHKTQVFFFPRNDHVCTRLDHSLYVANIATVICRNLAEKDIPCDPTLANAIGIGHDVGHPPFGHAGEKKLDTLAAEIGGFKHEKHSLRIVDKIEKPRSNPPVIGLNLTLAVRDGIANHCGESKTNKLAPRDPKLAVVIEKDTTCVPSSLEGCVVRLVDKISYLGRDIEDAIVAGFVQETHLPGEVRARIGSKNGEIVEYFVKDLIENSSSGEIALSDEASRVMDRMYDFNYSHIYKRVEIQSYVDHVNELLERLFHKFYKAVSTYQDQIDKYESDSHKCVQVLGEFIGKRSVLYFKEESFSSDELRSQRMTIDFLSTLTDRFAFDSFSELFLPQPLV